MNTVTPPRAEENHSLSFMADIQIARAVAILAVLFYHYSFLSTVISGFHLTISNPLYSGVDLFFVISGFVVMRSILRSSFEPFGFAMRRIFRLYPTLLTFIVVAFVVNEFYRHVMGNEWAKGFFSIPGKDFISSALTVLGGYYINSPIWSYSFGAIWSLSVEFQFYAAVFVLLIAVGLLRVPVQKSKKVFFICAFLILSYAVYSRLELWVRPISFAQNYLINYRFDFMIAGVLLAFVPQAWFHTLARRTPSYAPLLSLLCGWIALLFFRTPETAEPTRDRLMSTGMLISNAAFVATVALCAGGNKYKSLPPFVASMLLSIGDRSYTIYLLHFPAMAIAWFFISKYFPGWSSNGWYYGVLQIIFASLWVFLLSEPTYRFIEKPSIRWIHRVTKKPNALAKAP